ncbi:MAG: MBL fold metallo-hydrolase [Myxococcales bacterium]|nr:MBL fold metallo-hydrolase [Myxococcales bacterium]MDH5565715.1 MBL fold metallo-hydrolase [Myxococcales bacterium]
MRRIVGAVFAVLALVASIAAIYGYLKVVTLDVERVTDDVHVIYGLGGNVGVLRTKLGAVIVDTMSFRLQGRQIRERAERLAGPTQAIVNTHYHLDHTHGNPAFASGMRVLSTQRTRAYLGALDASYWMGDASGTLPNETFEQDYELRLEDKTVRLLHPGRGHTDGDLVAYFVEDRVVHMGDLFFNRRYPNIDLEAGGSVREWVASIDRVLELDFDTVIPGHGPVTDREGLRAFRHFMQQLAAIGEEVARTGRTLEETLARARLDADAGYQVIAIPFVMRLDREFVIRRTWEEATGRFERVVLR